MEGKDRSLRWCSWLGRGARAKSSPEMVFLAGLREEEMADDDPG
jgi:hypothetical protein